MIIEGYFLFLIETICCDPSSESSHRDGSDEGSHRDGSDEGSQHTFLCIIYKHYPLLSTNTRSYFIHHYVTVKLSSLILTLAFIAMETKILT